MKTNEASPISIWQPDFEGEELIFVRPPILPLGDHYADRSSFLKHKKPGTTRICFFGESVATGYLYAPLVSPAKLLEYFLTAACADAPFEIIDLARTNETLEGLIATVESAAQLQPDILVIFVGNNWTMLETPELSPYFPEVEARLSFAQILRKDGMNTLIQEANWRIIQKATTVFDRIATLAKELGSKVILITPEVNLADWENRQACPWLPGNGTAQWYEHFEKAKKALLKSDWPLAIQHAWAMEELDASLCPTTYRLLYHAFLGQGKDHLARQAAQAEVDSNRYVGLCFLGAPQINSGFRILQQKIADQHQFARIDLPEIFEQYTGTCLPGRRMFLDYCHLTLEGMQVAMAATAMEVIRLLNKPTKHLDWPSLLTNTPVYSASPEADATAKFGAAIHSAHRLLNIDDSSEILQYWCRAALAASPGIQEAMLAFYSSRMKPVPAVLTKTQHQNFHSPYALMMQHGLKYNYIDAPLLQVIEQLLEVPAAMIQSFENTDTNLIHPPYCLWAPVERFYPAAMQVKHLPGQAFFRAVWPESSFTFLQVEKMALQVEITLRLPTIPGWEEKRRDKVLVKIDETPIAKVWVNEKWTKVVLAIESIPSSSCLKRLSLVWPPLPPSGNEAIEGCLSRLELGQFADLHPVFGEVFSIKIREKQDE